MIHEKGRLTLFFLPIGSLVFAPTGSVGAFLQFVGYVGICFIMHLPTSLSISLSHFHPPVPQPSPRWTLT